MKHTTIFKVISILMAVTLGVACVSAYAISDQGGKPS